LYLYLHGFASGPRSRKAQYFQDRLTVAGLEIQVPDFNIGSFEHFTLSRQLQQAAAGWSGRLEPLTVIGSSLGGWAALLLAQQYLQIDRLILLAPALGFPGSWLDQLGAAALAQWQQQGSWPVYHYGEQREISLAYDFVVDAQQYRSVQLQRSIPTLILHGLQDEVVPITLSRQYAAARPTVKLVELDSDHGLGDVLPRLWQETVDFCGIPS
jgi:uncharacterized protein